MNKKTVLVDMIGGTFRINSSSKIIDITYDKNNLNYVVEYFESPFDDELDVYQVKDLYFKNEDEHSETDNLNGYVFYGKYWDKIQNDYFILLAKQTDRIDNIKLGMWDVANLSVEEAKNTLVNPDEYFNTK